MEIQDAANLIRKGIDENTVQHWADFGCGAGTFTKALATLLPSGSAIDATDISFQHLPQIFGNKVPIQFGQADFVKDDLPLQNLNGILMANSLHYVKDKTAFIRKAENYLSDRRNFIIIEYDTNSANRWVPYPIGFSELKKLFEQLGYRQAIKIGERPSVFGRGNIYAARITK